MTEMYLKEELSSVASTKWHVFEKKNKQMVTVDQALRKPVSLLTVYVLLSHHYLKLSSIVGYLEADIWRRVGRIVAVHDEGENHKEQRRAFRCVLLLCYNCCFIESFFPCVFVCTSLETFSDLV